MAAASAPPGRRAANTSNHQDRTPGPHGGHHRSDSGLSGCCGTSASQRGPLLYRVDCVDT
ncbi:hypothetical protein EYF80_047030 [Liparis tanakae]|uniref:Uncharacterized protein n=1 Tax=Liparis tanakae TaxID=230148 RepID=A0A4Z2FP04_9TELE|nr:hypothetical protein EYF80_047030 [Liparis tanakae]